MSEKIITKISKARFNVLTNTSRSFQLVLNFNPIIDRFKLTGNYQLIHWQAKPKGSRQWGIYNSVDDSYKSLNELELKGTFKSLQIPDEEVVSIPSAVLILRNNV